MDHKILRNVVRIARSSYTVPLNNNIINASRNHFLAARHLENNRLINNLPIKLKLLILTLVLQNI